MPPRPRRMRVVPKPAPEVPPAEERQPDPSAGALAELEREITARYGRLPTPLNSYGYDPFGFDARIARYPGMLFALMYRYWFRVESHGIENLPAAGPVLVVANHAG